MREKLRQWYRNTSKHIKPREWSKRAKDDFKKVPLRFKIVGAVILVIVLIIAVMRIGASIELAHETKKQAISTVATTKATHGPSTEVLLMPANVAAWHEATVYARTNGYIRDWYVDIGSKVKEGDLLAEIETPEVDQQLRQAEADLNTAIANDNLAQITAKRWVNLLKTDSVSKQETDEKVSAAQATAAMVKSVRANRDRLRDLVGFKRVIAPFDGIISDRRTDIGALINAGRTSFPALFHIVQASPLRIYVRVPQYFAPRLTPGMTATIEFAERPGKQYQVKLLETAQAIDPVTRTLLAQFTADNADYSLKTGSYTQISLTLHIPDHIVRLPVNTLIFNSKGLQVAVVGNDNKAVLRPITISRDFGNEIEISHGVKDGETVIVDPSDSIFSGQEVRVVKRTVQAAEQ